MNNNKKIYKIQEYSNKNKTLYDKVNLMKIFKANIFKCNVINFHNKSPVKQIFSSHNLLKEIFKIKASKTHHNL